MVRTRTIKELNLDILRELPDIDVVKFHMAMLHHHHRRQSALSRCSPRRITS
jgi:hypothetical protein